MGGGGGGGGGGLGFGTDHGSVTCEVRGEGFRRNQHCRKKVGGGEGGKSPRPSLYAALGIEWQQTQVICMYMYMRMFAD